jgi:cytochrome c-type biogenesis protein CcmH/NrfG
LGEEARAESALLESIRRNPANVEARYRLARLYLDRGRAREALQQARQALRISKSQRLMSLIEQIQARIEDP